MLGHFGMIPLINHDSRVRSQWGRDQIYPDSWNILVIYWLNPQLYNIKNCIVFPFHEQLHKIIYDIMVLW